MKNMISSKQLVRYLLCLQLLHTVWSSCFLDTFCREEDSNATCNTTTHRCNCSNQKRYGGPKCESINKCQIDDDCRKSGDGAAVCENSTCTCTQEQGFGGRYCSRSGDCISDSDCNVGGDALAVCSYSEVSATSATGTCCCSDPEYGGSWCRSITGTKASGRCYNDYQCRKEGDNNATCTNQFCVCSGGTQTSGNSPFSGPFCEPRHLKTEDPGKHRSIIHAVPSRSEQRCVILEDNSFWCWGVDQVQYDYSPDNINKFSNYSSNDKLCSNCAQFDESAWACYAANGCVWSPHSFPARPKSMTTVPSNLATPKCRSCTEITDWTENVLGSSQNAETQCRENTCKVLSFPSPRVAQTSYCANKDQYSPAAKKTAPSDVCHWAMGNNIGIIPDEYFPGGSSYNEWRFLESRVKPSAHGIYVDASYIPDANGNLTEEMRSHQVWTRFNVIKNALSLDGIVCPSQDQSCCMKTGFTNYATRNACEAADWTWKPGKLVSILHTPSFGNKTSCFKMLSKLSGVDDVTDGEYIINSERWTIEIWCVPGDDKLETLLSFGSSNFYTSYEDTIKFNIDFDEGETSEARGKGVRCYTAFNECKTRRILNQEQNNYKRCLLCKVDKTTFDPDFSSTISSPIRDASLTDSGMCITDGRGRLFCKGSSAIDVGYTASDTTLYSKYFKHPQGGQCKRVRKASQNLNGSSSDTLLCVIRVTGIVECFGRSISIGDGSIDINTATELTKIYSNPFLYNIDINYVHHSATSDEITIEKYLFQMMDDDGDGSAFSRARFTNVRFI